MTTPSGLCLSIEGAEFDNLVGKLRANYDPSRRYELRATITESGLQIWALDCGPVEPLRAEKVLPPLAHSKA